MTSPPASFLPSPSFDFRDDSIVPLDELNPVEVARQMNIESHKMILAGFSIAELSRETDDVRNPPSLHATSHEAHQDGAHLPECFCLNLILLCYPQAVDHLSVLPRVNMPV